MERDSSAACRPPVLRNSVLWETAVKQAIAVEDYLRTRALF
jgi:hypothetical protein